MHHTPANATPGISPAQHAVIAETHPQLFRPTAPAVDRAMRLTELIAVTGCSRTAVYELVKAGKLPRPSKIGRVSVWRASAVQSYLDGVFGVTTGGAK